MLGFSAKIYYCRLFIITFSNNMLVSFSNEDKIILRNILNFVETEIKLQ